MEDKSAHPNSGDATADDTIAQAAAEWIIRRERGLGREEEAALREWTYADERHAAELAAATADWQRLDRADAIPALAAEADDIVHQARSAARRRRRIGFSGAFCAAAAAIVVTFVGITKRPEVSSRTANYQIVRSTERRL